MTLTPISDFFSELRPRFSGELRADAASRLLYSTDASLYQIEPLGVAIPKNQDDLQAVVELAARRQIPILARGSGSSLAGQAIGPALILDTSRHLDRIIEINPEAQSATVEPGVILAQLNRAAARHGLMFGPDPASAERATLGGVIGNNATGAHSILYGMSADHLLSAETLMADGSLARWGEIGAFHMKDGSLFSALTEAALQIRLRYADVIRADWPRTWRNSAGYRLNYLLNWSPAAPPRWYRPEAPYPGSDSALNLAPLLAGSEGTLAVIRRATLRLVPKPRHTVLAILEYDSISAACDDVPRLLTFSPSAVELIPRMLLQLARGVPAYAAQLDFVSGDPAALLVVEFSGGDPVELEKQALALGKCRVATSSEAQSRIWNVRKAGLGIFDSGPGPVRPLAFIEDCAIPVENLGEFVREMEKILAEHQTRAAYYAHASAGCLHIRPLLDLHNGAGRRALRTIAEATHALTMRLGGAMASEHGDGLARGEFLPKTYGAEIMQAFRLLKNAADPQNLLNPGKILDVPPLDANLRHGELYQPQPWRPALDFSRQNGLTGAVEQCNGAGVCRKSGGVMCPSFQATREESNATRGRANLLRALLNGRGSPLAAPPAFERAVYEAMGLCLACKGCKAECPSGVDMAKLKYEYQHEYYKTHRRPPRDYFFGYINEAARLGAPFGALANRLTGWPPARNLLNRALNLAPQRRLPQFAVSAARISQAASPLSAALFLPDAFTHFFEPEIESAGLRLLAAAQISVERLPLLGAGRTLISKGFLESAKKQAARLLNEVARRDPAGNLPLIGLEPSEIYTLRDELRDLLPERAAEAEALAARAWLMDEFLIRPGAEGISPAARLASAAPALPAEKVLLHGHCYQKAQPPAADGLPVGQAATAALLRAFGFEVEIIASGCCGMAGAFGYEGEHYAISQAVGEQVLFPALRARGTAQIAAPGTSCRAQIAEGVGAQAQSALTLVGGRIFGV
ncbi:MAG: FAD-binding and (Fe-S)-binding domain-containing protein [Anaerolineales bacterium]